MLAAGPVADQTPAPGTITVNGNAEVRVAPNEVILTVGVETDSLDIARARSENDRRIKAISDAARARGVAAEHVKTDFLDIQPRYKDDYPRREFLGFFARRSLVITLRDVSKFEPLLSSVLTAGANYVHGIDFRTTELRKHRDAARALALIAAREKAGAMAGTLNVTLGAPVTIQEGYSGWWSPYTSWGGSDPAAWWRRTSPRIVVDAPRRVKTRSSPDRSRCRQMCRSRSSSDRAGKVLWAV